MHRSNCLIQRKLIWLIYGAWDIWMLERKQSNRIFCQQHVALPALVPRCRCLFPSSWPLEAELPEWWEIQSANGGVTAATLTKLSCQPVQETAWAFSLKETFSSYLLKNCVEGTTSVVRMKQLGNVTENVTEINEKNNYNKKIICFCRYVLVLQKLRYSPSRFFSGTEAVRKVLLKNLYVGGKPHKEKEAFVLTHFHSLFYLRLTK